MKLTSPITLSTPISTLFSVGPVYAKRLKKLGISSIEDLIYYFPYRHEDYSLISKISLLQEGETVTVIGKINFIKNIYTKYGKNIQEAEIEDETGKITSIWFNQPFLVKNFLSGDKISLSGKVGWFRKKLVFLSPDFEIVRNTLLNQKSTIHTGRLVPIYSETYGISSKWLRSKIFSLLPIILPQIKEYLPNTYLKKYSFFDLKTAIRKIHFPETKNEYQKAKERLSLDELLLLQIASQKRKRIWQKESVGNPLQISKYKEKIESFWKQIPFELTNAQKKVINDIFVDLSKKTPMNRLLQGEVGSGKTVVATIAMYLSYLNNFQSAFMAPTEILAKQHFETVSHILKPLGVKIGLFTGSEKPKTNDFNIYIGTHALFSEKHKFKKLALVIIDEQHRFGVEQRAKLQEKGINPHLLSLTATPIPRTVALTVFSELDLSVIDEMPTGRKKVKTWVVPKDKRENAYKWIREQISKEHSQCFVICPLIEESETLKSIKAVTTEFAKLKKDVFPDLKLGLLHGKLKSKEKETVLNSFRKGDFDILVATPVVEVGIDIPNVTIILIEEADRFGLAQLHQLRGRVGRGDKNSYCLLFSNSDSEIAIKRLKKMEETNIGMELAEYDLHLRGPGEIYGIKQHGIPELKIANYNNLTLIEMAKTTATDILEKDPNLESYPSIKSKLEEKLKALIPPN